MQPTVGTPEQGMILREGIGELMISSAAGGCMGNGNRRNHDRVRTDASRRRSPDGDTSAPTSNGLQMERPWAVPFYVKGLNTGFIDPSHSVSNPDRPRNIFSARESSRMVRYHLLPLHSLPAMHDSLSPDPVAAPPNQCLQPREKTTAVCDSLIGTSVHPLIL